MRDESPYVRGRHARHTRRGYGEVPERIRGEEPELRASRFRARLRRRDDGEIEVIVAGLVVPELTGLSTAEALELTER